MDRRRTIFNSGNGEGSRNANRHVPPFRRNDSQDSPSLLENGLQSVRPTPANETPNHPFPSETELRNNPSVPGIEPNFRLAIPNYQIVYIPHRSIPRYMNGYDAPVSDPFQDRIYSTHAGTLLENADTEYRGRSERRRHIGFQYLTQSLSNAFPSSDNRRLSMPHLRDYRVLLGHDLPGNREAEYAMQYNLPMQDIRRSTNMVSFLIPSQSTISSGASGRNVPPFSGTNLHPVERRPSNVSNTSIIQKARECARSVEVYIDAGNLCEVCVENKANAAYLCGHVICGVCLVKCLRGSGECNCHKCRKVVTDFIRLYT